MDKNYIQRLQINEVVTLILPEKRKKYVVVLLFLSRAMLLQLFESVALNNKKSR